MGINITINVKSGRVRIELSEEQPTKLAPEEEYKTCTSESKQVHVRAHWRRLKAKP